jgi:hypothetical protein
MTETCYTSHRTLVDDLVGFCTEELESRVQQTL